MALLILALLQRIFLMSSLMLLLVWLIFFMVLIKLLPILGTISGKTVKLAVLDLTEDDFDFLTSNKVWIATDRSRARRCVEACVYGTLDFVGYPRFPAPVEFIAAVIA